MSYASYFSATDRFPTFKKAVDDGGGAADALLDIDGVKRAIFGARAAFHAAIAVRYPDLTLKRLEHPVWADGKAHPAARALIQIVLQCDNIL